MKFTLSTVLFATSATAFPIFGQKDSTPQAVNRRHIFPTIDKRAVFNTTTFTDLSISGGVAGNAEEEALAKLAGLPEDLSTVEEADLEFLEDVNGIANDAEVEAFNVAIESAGGEEAEALERGKTKNKVLKLTATMLKLQAEAAQGQDVAAEIEEEELKLSSNIAADQEAAGLPSTNLSFEASTGE